MKTKIIAGLMLFTMLFSGMAFADTLVPTPNTPADDTWSTSLTVTLNCSCVGNNSEGYNLTFWVDNVNVSHNDSLDNNTATYFAHTFSADDCTGASWKCQCLTDNQTVINGTARTIKIDATAPTATYDGNPIIEKGSINYIEYTTADGCAVDTRWWQREDYDSSSSTTFVDTDDIETWNMISGIYTFNYTLNDSAGNVASRTDVIIVKSKDEDEGVIQDYTSVRPKTNKFASIASDAAGVVDSEVVSIGDFVLKVWMLGIIVIIIALVYKYRD